MSATESVHADRSKALTELIELTGELRKREGFLEGSVKARDRAQVNIDAESAKIRAAKSSIQTLVARLGLHPGGGQ